VVKPQRQQTGAPLAIMDGNLISAMRTGAVIGLGAKYLANKNAKVAGIIAAGVISKPLKKALARSSNCGINPIGISRETSK